MKNYAEMTDFEINCLVAEATGHRPLISQYGWKGSQVGDYTKV
ncbi:phage protein NinX family protein, partial [Yersinia pestis]